MRAVPNSSSGSGGIRRACVLVGPLVLAVIVAGCSKKPEAGTETADESKEILAQIAVDDSLAVKLEAGIEETIRMIEGIESTDKGLHEAFAGVLARPGEVRTEIVYDVDTRSQATALEQVNAERDLTASMDEADASLERNLRAQFADMHSSLAGDDRLVRFFFTQQDSVNRLLLGLVDATRPYDSVLSPGKGGPANPLPRP